jgi:hypothetical protein
MMHGQTNVKFTVDKQAKAIHSYAPEDERNHRPKHVELIGIINKPLLLHLVGCLYYLYQ